MNNTRRDTGTIMTEAPDSEPVATQTGSRRVARRFSAVVRFLRSKTFRAIFLVIVVALLAVALVKQGPTLWQQVQQLSAPVVGLAFVAALCGVLCSLMVWRAVLNDLGSRLSIADSSRVMFIGQLAKYVPGSVWQLVAQIELAADHGVPRGRTAVSVIVSSALMVCTGGVVAVVTLPIAGADAATSGFWALAVVPIVVALLCPPVLNRLLRRLLRVLRRRPLEQGVSWRGLVPSLCWALLAWTFNGFMTYVIVARFAGHSASLFILCVGGFALSWVTGFLAVFSPAGAGVREAVMVAVLSTQTSTTVALTVALVSRALIVACDAVTGAAAGALVGRRRLRELRATRSDEDPSDAMDTESRTP
jgi:glycosyltransferase 2 family protein